MTAEMNNGIEGIDPHAAILSLFLPSVKQVSRGDGFCLQKKRINGSCKEGVGGDQIVPRLPPRPSRVMLSSEQDGGGTSVTDSAPAGDELPVPRVDHQSNSLHTCLEATKCTQTHN